MNREHTKKIKVGNIYIGGSNNVLIQSMCNVKTSNINKVIKQINDCYNAGAQLMRVSVLDLDDAKAIKEIKKKIKIPLVADIHFDYRLALESIKSGVDAIRINPGNIGDKNKIKLVVDACKKHNISIRIGVNAGSLDKTISKHASVKALIESTKKHVKILEDLNFKNIVISIKADNVKDSINTYRLASKTFNYPLHLGITEAGPSDIGIIRSAAALSPLLLDGIGDTIRISLSDDPIKEIISAKRLLHDLGLYKNYPTLISCPTCGRTQVNLLPIAKKVLSYLEEHNLNYKIAVMGCVVNGPGEAKECDLGLAGGNKEWVIFKHSKLIRKVKDKNAYTEFIKEINKLKLK